MRWLKIFIYIIILYAGTTQQQFYLSSIEQETKVDERVEKLQSFFGRYSAPMGAYTSTFLRAADDNKLDWKLLPTIAMAESSGGKRYKNNAFGWGSDKIDYGDDAADISAIALRLATGRYYQTYKETQRLSDFCLAYNGKYAETYCDKIRYFYNQL